MERQSVLIIAMLAIWSIGDHVSATPPSADPKSSALHGADDITESRIAGLIEQLGDDRFFARQQAEKELLAIGHNAFDQLKAAEDDPDPEVAARARFIARRLAVDWVQPDDPPLVRNLLDGYDNLNDDERKSVVDALVTRARGASVPALCRIARFDASDFVSRYAALAITRCGALGEEAAAEQREQIIAGVGRSRRTAARWVRTYLVELTDPESALTAWRQHTIQQRTNLNQQAIDLTIGLLRQQARVLDRLGREIEMLDTWFEMLSLDLNDDRKLLSELIVRLIDEKRFKAIDRVAVTFRDRFRTNPELLYFVAEAHLEQGKNEKAVQAADDAFALTVDPGLRLQVARRLMRRGRADWSEREFREIIKKLPATQIEAIFAHSWLASMLYDHERYQDAAELFATLLKQSKENEKAGKALETVSPIDLKHFAARHAYYAACHHRSLGDRVKEREQLDKAIQYDPTDIDVLIAMFALPDDALVDATLPDTDEAYRRQTRMRIDTAAKMLDRQIRRNPGEAVGYNNWAWLVANTFGDFELAVERAEQAVNLADEDSLAGHLDTLARCYFTVGDVESALEHQERAVSLDPHTRQLKRQLELFKKAHSEKERAAAER